MQCVNCGRFLGKIERVEVAGEAQVWVKMLLKCGKCGKETKIDGFLLNSLAKP